MILPIVACLVLAGILVWQMLGSNVTVGQIEQADRQIALATRIQLLVVDEESGLRGYQTTSDPRFLPSYTDAQAPLQQTIAEFQSLPGGGSETLNQFIREHDVWHTSFAEPLIITIRSGGQTNDVDLNLTGKTSMDSMRARLNSVIAAADRRRTGSINKWEQQRNQVLTLLIGLALAVGLFIGLFTRGRLQSVSAAFSKALDLERSRAEELFQSEQNLRTTLASIGDGVITCDQNGRVQLMNPVAQELTGWLESQARDHPLDEVFNTVDETTRLPVENPVTKVQRLNRVVGIANHTILIRKDGSEISIDDSGSPIRNGAGELTGVVN